MKKQFIAVIAIAALILLFVSCKWFQNRKTDSSNLLTGKWRIDSVDRGNDSNAIGFLLLAFSRNDSLDYEFGKDTVLFYSKDTTEKMKYEFDSVKKQLTFKDSANTVYGFRQINDSLIALTDKDSSTLFLKKVK